jgi:c-di-GMP-binding flagellar brake protein YcgR
MLGIIPVDPERLIADIRLPGCGGRAYGEILTSKTSPNDLVVKVIASNRMDSVSTGDAAEMMSIKVGQATHYTCCVQKYEGDILHLRWDTPGREVKRRLGARYPTHLSAEFSPSGQNSWVPCKVEDISAGGLRLRLVANDSCTGLIDVRVSLVEGTTMGRDYGGAKKLELTCRVMRDGKSADGHPTVGVAFTHVDKRTEAILERLLDFLSSDV